MLTDQDVVTFIATTQPEKAKAFYCDVLGLRFVEDTPFALVFDAGGIMLRITPVEGHKPVDHTVLGWKVPDIAATAKGLAAKGVAFERYSFLKQDSAGVWTSPDGAKVAWFKDPDGNVLSVTEFAGK